MRVRCFFAWRASIPTAWDWLKSRLNTRSLWTSEVVWQEQPTSGAEGQVGRTFDLATLLDAAGRPVVLVSCHFGERSWLKVFRPAESE